MPAPTLCRIRTIDYRRREHGHSRSRAVLGILGLGTPLTVPCTLAAELEMRELDERFKRAIRRDHA